MPAEHCRVPWETNQTPRSCGEAPPWDGGGLPSDGLRGQRSAIPTTKLPPSTRPTAVTTTAVVVVAQSPSSSRDDTHLDPTDSASAFLMYTKHSE